ncbi:ribonuclease H1 domain-containing protein [Methanococcus maripaludis]|uniref:Ribonuclease H n=1 Tax=Methanococcus maripaludis TaxID=39152 RepID=A0A2L1C871_METMI|nr:ribonuclease H family protein [Methanococcus maripaludis]AVB75578.1 Ribonuclease H [Methanococcus maripaludis]MBA2863903.1 ribonuclease HI [Methanococcus maripaludis]MBB6496091.1 ribonuclease HI [Methanococcus maripaludis]
MSKIYAVRKGRKTGLFDTWAECENQVKGFSGAEFKSFTSKIDAEAYLNLKSEQRQNNIKSDEFKKDVMHAWVDGSFNLKNKEYGAGALIIFNGIKKEIKAKGNDTELSKMRNVAGEILASELAMEYAVSKNVKNLVIYHDYLGIEKWCTGEWKTNKSGTIEYKEKCKNYLKKLNIEFVKVKAHSGDKNNEIADKLAKESLL